jgi:hypothetical protein
MLTLLHCKSIIHLYKTTTESIDYVATQAAVRQIKQHPDKNAVIQLTGRHVWNRELIIDTPLCIDGGHRVNTIEQLNWTDATPTSGSYVMLTGDGATCRTIRTRRAYRGAHTDPYDSPLSSAINVQADGVTLRNLCVFMQITPSLVTNAANYNLQAAVTPTLSGGVGIAPNYWGAPQVYTPKAWADVAGAPAKNWDVGVFIGTRLKTTIESCSFAFFENASVYNDITNIASRPLTDWRGNALPANSVSGSDGMTMTKCYMFGSPYGVRVLGALPKSGLVSYGKDYKTSVQLTIAVNPTSGDKLLIGGYDYDRVTNLPASGAVFESTTFTFINSDEEAPTGEVGVVIGATTAQTAENLVRAITALLDDNDEGVSALIKPLFNYANYSSDGTSVVMAFARGFSSASLTRFLNCFEMRHSNATAFTVTSGQTSLGGGLYKIVPVVGSDPAPYFWGSAAPDFIEDGRGAYGASDMYITECQFFALKRPSISGTPVYVKQIRTDRNWQLDDGGGAAIEIDGLAGNSSRCIQKHFHSKNRVDGQSVLSHIRLGRANAVTLEQCHPDGTVSRPDIYSAAAASYGWLTRTPYTKVTAQVGYGVPRPHPDAARVTDGWYQSVGTTRLGNGGIDGYGALIGTRLRIEVPAVTGGEGRADVIGGNSGKASVRLGTTNNINTFRLQFFGSSGNGYVRNYGGNVLYEVPTGSYHNFQFRDAGTGTTTSRARLTETSFDVLNGLRIGAIGVGGVLIRSGAGSPEGVLTANIGSMYLRTDGGTGTTLYSKESGTGSVGWVSIWSSAIANTDALPEGSTNLYHTSQRVRDATLSGFSATNSSIISTDSVLQAFGKAQGQINALAAATPVYIFTQSNKTIRSVGTALNSTLSAFGSNLSFASGFLQLNDILEFEFWIKTAGSTTGTVQMRLSVNGNAQDVFWSLPLTADTTVRLSKVRLSFIVDYLPNNSTSTIPIFYANDNGTTRGTITPITRIIISSDPTQALTLNFNGFVGGALTAAGSEFLFLESNVTIKRSA